MTIMAADGEHLPLPRSCHPECARRSLRNARITRAALTAPTRIQSETLRARARVRAQVCLRVIGQWRADHPAECRAKHQGSARLTAAQAARAQQLRTA